MKIENENYKKTELDSLAPYIAKIYPPFAENILERTIFNDIINNNETPITIIDPFCGSSTSLFEIVKMIMKSNIEAAKNGDENLKFPKIYLTGIDVMDYPIVVSKGKRSFMKFALKVIKEIYQNDNSNNENEIITTYIKKPLSFFFEHFFTIIKEDPIAEKMKQLEKMGEEIFDMVGLEGHLKRKLLRIYSAESIKAIAIINLTLRHLIESFNQMDFIYTIFLKCLYGTGNSYFSIPSHQVLMGANMDVKRGKFNVENYRNMTYHEMFYYILGRLRHGVEYNAIKYFQQLKESFNNIPKQSAIKIIDGIINILDGMTFLPMDSTADSTYQYLSRLIEKNNAPIKYVFSSPPYFDNVDYKRENAWRELVSGNDWIILTNEEIYKPNDPVKRPPVLTAKNLINKNILQYRGGYVVNITTVTANFIRAASQNIKVIYILGDVLQKTHKSGKKQPGEIISTNIYKTVESVANGLKLIGMEMEQKIIDEIPQNKKVSKKSFEGKQENIGIYIISKTITPKYTHQQLTSLDKKQIKLLEKELIVTEKTELTNKFNYYYQKENNEPAETQEIEQTEDIPQIEEMKIMEEIEEIKDASNTINENNNLNQQNQLNETNDPNNNNNSNEPNDTNKI